MTTESTPENVASQTPNTEEVKENLEVHVTMRPTGRKSRSGSRSTRAKKSAKEPAKTAAAAEETPETPAAESASAPVIEPVAEPIAEPVVETPVAPEPVVSEPVAAEPVAAEPVAAEPAAIIPPVTEETPSAAPAAEETAPEKPAKPRRGRSRTNRGRAKAAVEATEAAVQIAPAPEATAVAPVAEETPAAPVAEQITLPPVVEEISAPPMAQDVVPSAAAEETVPPPVAGEIAAAPVAVEPTPAPADEAPAVAEEVAAGTISEEIAPPAKPKTRRGRGRSRGRGKKEVVAEAPAEEITPTEAVAEPVAEAPVGEIAAVVVEEVAVVAEELVAEPVQAPTPAPAKEKPGRKRNRRSRGAGATAEGESEAHRERAAVGNKEIIVNVEPRETRIALIEAQKLMELHIEREERVVGSIYKGRVANVLPGMDAAFVDIGLERNAFLYVGDILPEAAADMVTQPRRRDMRNMRIKDMVKPNQEILIQVVKAPRGTKGARVSTRISLPGRYIVLMPESDNLGISRKVDDPAERDRLKRIGERIRPKNFGIIIRTEAEGQGEAELRQDVDLILNLWGQIQEKAAVTPAPGLVHQDLSIIFKTIRDVFSEDVGKLIIDSPSDYEKASELVHYISPKLESRLVLYDEPEPIFERYGIEAEIERLLRPKVWLKSGGYLTIDQTEALTTVDVNTGKFIGSTSLSETILRTNLDAASEVARQLRLRDIGGIIIIDFIDMSSPKDRSQVMQALEKALKTDRTRTKIAHLSPLGLVEMTRKRTSESVTEILTDPCPYCAGRGRISSPDTVAIQIERSLRKQCALTDEEAFLVWAHPDVAAQLIGAGGDEVERLEHELRRALYIRADSSLHVEQYKILPGDLQELNRQMLPYRGGQVVEALIDDSQLFSPPRAAAWTDGYLLDVVNGGEHGGERSKVKLSQVYRSYAFGEVVKPAKVLDKSEPI